MAAAGGRLGVGLDGVASTDQELPQSPRLRPRALHPAAVAGTKVVGAGYRSLATGTVSRVTWPQPAVAEKVPEPTDTDNSED